MEWMYGMYLSVVACNNIKPILMMNSVYKKYDLGHYSWSNSEFIHDVWFDVFIWNMGAIAEYPAQLFTCVGFLWRTRYITIVAILIQWDANGWAGYSAI